MTIVHGAQALYGLINIFIKVEAECLFFIYLKKKEYIIICKLYITDQIKTYTYRYLQNDVSDTDR